MCVSPIIKSACVARAFTITMSLNFLQHNLRLRQALFWFRSHPSEGARGSPSGEQAHGGHKVWVLHLGECLLVDRFIVVRHARPLAQEGQKRPIEEAEIFNKELSLAGPCMVLHERGMRLHVLKLCLLEEMDEL